MAPHSDVDVAFITPGRNNAWCEQVIEAMLYFLWDLSLTIGHSSRSVDEMVKQCKADLTIRTAMLEGRYVWGDQSLWESRRRFWSDVVSGSERQFVAEKLAERDERHKRLGDSRYHVEPNVKESKGGAARPAHAVLDRQIHLQGAKRRRTGRCRPVDPATNTDRSAAPPISSGRCAATCMTSLDGPRIA
jgi:UTP:GlnB (protein PII) uridylyltransferase